MRFTRLLAFATWVVVALLAVAAFAAFSPPGTDAAIPATTASATQESVVIPADIGAAAGRQAAFGFSQDLLTLQAPTTTTTTTTSTTTTTLPPTTTTTSTTTTTKQVVTTTAKPKPAAAPLPPEAVYSLVAKYFQPEDVELAVLIVWCESRYDANAVNPSSGASGLFQHLPRFWESRSAAAGIPGANILDPEANTVVAAWLRYENGGWKHWNPSKGCWGSGTVVAPSTTTTTTLTTLPPTPTTEPTITNESSTTTTSTTVSTS